MFCAFVVCNTEDRSSRWSDCTDYSCSKQIVSVVLTCERITKALIILHRCADRSPLLLKNYASGRQTASHQDKKEVSSEEKPLNRKPKRKKNKSSTLPSGPKSAKQHSVQDSSNVKAEQPKLKKKPPAVVARDRARRKEYWKRMKVPRQLRAENLALFYKLQELQTVASPQIPVVRQPEKSGCLERTSAHPIFKSTKLTEKKLICVHRTSCGVGRYSIDYSLCYIVQYIGVGDF